MTRFHPEKIRQVFFILLLLGTAGILFYELRGFISSFLGAVTLYVLMRKFMKYLLADRWKPWLAAITMMLASLVIIMLPVYLLIDSLSSRVAFVISHAQEITASITQYLRGIEQADGYKFMNEDTVRNVSGMAIGQLPGILGGTFNAVLDLVAMYFMLYFLLTGTNRIEVWLSDVLPLRADNLARVKKEANSYGDLQRGRYPTNRAGTGRGRADRLPHRRCARTPVVRLR